MNGQAAKAAMGMNRRDLIAMKTVMPAITSRARSSLGQTKSETFRVSFFVAPSTMRAVRMRVTVHIQDQERYGCADGVGPVEGPVPLTDIAPSLGMLADADDEGMGQVRQVVWIKDHHGNEGGRAGRHGVNDAFRAHNMHDSVSQSDDNHGKNQGEERDGEMHQTCAGRVVLKHLLALRVQIRRDRGKVACKKDEEQDARDDSMERCEDTITNPLVECHRDTCGNGHQPNVQHPVTVRGYGLEPFMMEEPVSHEAENGPRQDTVGCDGPALGQSYDKMPAHEGNEHHECVDVASMNVGPEDDQGDNQPDVTCISVACQGQNQKIGGCE